MHGHLHQRLHRVQRVLWLRRQLLFLLQWVLWLLQLFRRVLWVLWLQLQRHGLQRVHQRLRLWLLWWVRVRVFRLLREKLHRRLRHGLLWWLPGHLLRQLLWRLLRLLRQDLYWGLRQRLQQVLWLYRGLRHRGQFHLRVYLQGRLLWLFCL